MNKTCINQPLNCIFKFFCTCTFLSAQFYTFLGEYQPKHYTFLGEYFRKVYIFLGENITILHRWGKSPPRSSPQTVLRYPLYGDTPQRPHGLSYSIKKVFPIFCYIWLQKNTALIYNFQRTFFYLNYISITCPI